MPDTKLAKKTSIDAVDFTDATKTVPQLLEVALSALSMLIYHLPKYDKNWFQNPIINTYLELQVIKEEMQSRKESLSVVNLPADIDKTLKVWYEQEKAGIPVEERVELSSEQKKTIEINKKLDQQVANLPFPEIAYNQGKPAVSMIALEKAL